jgi:hypothetical protein
MGEEGREGYLFRIVIGFSAGHVLCQAENAELFGDCQLDDLFKGVLCVARTELA